MGQGIMVETGSAERLAVKGATPAEMMCGLIAYSLN
jgi:hypothetical protein